MNQTKRKCDIECGSDRMPNFPIKCQGETYFMADTENLLTKLEGDRRITCSSTSISSIA